MTGLYQKHTIPNLANIQAELFKEIEHIVVNKKYLFYVLTFEREEMNKFPLLNDYLTSISKWPLLKNKPLKFFVSAGGVVGDIHADNHFTSKIALNIPVYGCSGTYLNYYDTPKENIKYLDLEKSIGRYSYYMPINTKIITQIEHLEFTEPYLLRTDILHNSENRTTDYRIIVTIRWEAPRELCNFEDFIKT
jgi:hypothetical protein